MTVFNPVYRPFPSIPDILSVKAMKGKEAGSAHCPKNNLNIRIKTKPVTIGANSAVYIWFLCHKYMHKRQAHTVPVAPASAQC